MAAEVAVDSAVVRRRRKIESVNRMVPIAMAVVVTAMQAACGAGPASGTAPTAPDVTSPVTGAPTEQTPATTAAPVQISDATVRATVQRFVGPEQQFSVELPTGFTEQGNGMVQGGGATFPNHYVYTATFVDVANHVRLTLSVERGVVANDAIYSGGAPTMAYDDVRPEGTVLASVDPVSKDTAMWWPADATSVVWVYSSGLTEDQLLKVVISIDTAPP